MATYYWTSTSSTDVTSAANWTKDDNTNEVPGASAVVVVRALATGVAADMVGDNSGTSWATVIVEGSYAGSIGSTSAYWKIQAASVRIDATGSGRIKINNTNTSQVTLVQASGEPTDTGYETVRLLTAGGTVSVTGGNVGIATNTPIETSTVATVNASGSQASVKLGIGVTWTTLNVADSATATALIGGTTMNIAAGSTATVYGGTKVTNVNNAGLAVLNNRPATDALVTYGGGTTDFSDNPATATVAAQTVHPNATIKLFPANPAHITFTATTIVECGTVKYEA